MEKWLKQRAKEPTTYAGLSLLTLGAGQVLKINEAPEIAGAIEQAAPALSAGDYVTGGVFLLSALASIFMRERGE
ncbi:MAG: hypothetical protein P1U69_03170 [Parvibaculaceae bacterium]|nr:hypothetical protein RHODOSMS8_00961 [Rhodobiaceae bacterium]MDF1846180.1 hypothetical protein [Parvibaculaceae bacterium]